MRWASARAVRCRGWLFSSLDSRVSSFYQSSIAFPRCARRSGCRRWPGWRWPPRPDLRTRHLFSSASAQRGGLAVAGDGRGGVMQIPPSAAPCGLARRCGLSVVEARRSKSRRARLNKAGAGEVWPAHRLFLNGAADWRVRPCVKDVPVSGFGFASFSSVVSTASNQAQEPSQRMRRILREECE